MPTNVDSGVTPLPDGDEAHWPLEEVTPEAARLLRGDVEEWRLWR